MFYFHTNLIVKNKLLNIICTFCMNMVFNKLRFSPVFPQLSIHPCKTSCQRVIYFSFFADACKSIVHFGGNVRISRY